MKLAPLYHKGKTGKVVEWKIWTKGPEIHVEWGEIDGKKQTTHTVATAKNVGKKNEIKPEAQAEIEAKAMWKHRVDRKYSETIKAAEETVFLPMLAHPFDKKKHTVKYPVDVQPKLDGNRALAYWEGDKVVLMSRGGKTWDIKHIQDAIAKFLPKCMILDGEIYKPGLNLQGINKLIKKFRPGPEGTESLKFYAFDCLCIDEDKTWADRKEDLADLCEASTDDIVGFVPTESAATEQEVQDLCVQYTDEGWEGVIVRKLDGLYTLGERSSDLLKVKMFQDDEFEIVDHYEGQGRHEGYIGFICKTDKDKKFKCYPRGDDKQRREYGKKPKSYYGQKLTVRFQFLTDEGIPFLPIGIAIRDDRDQP